MKSPLFRISVAETEKAVYLLSDFHHLIFDGASVALFFEQLKTLYEGGNIEPESYTYFDYAENEIKAENSDEFRNAEKFFDNMMKNFESASEITADLRGHAEDGALASQAVPVDMARVENFCSQHGITPAHLFLAGTFYAVSRFVNSRNVYISTISNGRSDMRLTNCFGMFVKTLALGIEIEDITSLEFVEKAKLFSRIQLKMKFTPMHSFVQNTAMHRTLCTNISLVLLITLKLTAKPLSVITLK